VVPSSWRAASWAAQALLDLGIHIKLVDLPTQATQVIIDAQTRQ
jgi:hypothetical protein